MAVSSFSLGASMSIFSSQILFDEKIIDQVGDPSHVLLHVVKHMGISEFVEVQSYRCKSTSKRTWLL